MNVPEVQEHIHEVIVSQIDFGFTMFFQSSFYSQASKQPRNDFQ